MSWGIELWDQYDNVSLHTQKGIENLERLGQFLRDRANIETEYAGKIRKLVKTYQPKKKDEEDEKFSSTRAFRDMLNEMNDLAGQHEIISESLIATVVKEIFQKIKEVKDEKKRFLADGARHHSNLQNQVANLDRSKKNYEKSFRESEKALDSFQRADADLNLSRAEVEKQRLHSLYKSQICEDSKKEYANQLDKANEIQKSYFNILMPGVFSGLQELDEKRINTVKNSLLQSVDLEKKVYPIINKCLDGISSTALQIDPKNETQLVIERFKSGFTPPEDFPFEDLSAIKSGEAPQTNGYGNGVRPSEGHILTYKGTLNGGKVKKRTGLFGIFGANKPAGPNDGRDDYAELPPNQRKKKLQQKIDEFTAKYQQENAAKDGLLKMQSVYTKNPQLGDPGAIETQLRESTQRLQRLQLDVQKYQTYLAEMDMPHSQNGKNRSSGSDESLSRSASDLSQNNHKPSAPTTPLPPNHGYGYGSSNSPESGISTSHTSLPDSDFDHIDSEAQDYYEQEPLPILGTCESLYPFDAMSEGSIPLAEREVLYVIELDQGDGWTRVRRNEGLEEGFVPTSYLRLNLYSSC